MRRISHRFISHAVGDAASAAEPKRRARVWLALAAGTLSLEIVVLLLSRGSCGITHSSRIDDLSDCIVRGLAGPWITAALLGAILDHRGRFREDFPLHVWSRRLSAICVSSDLFWLAGDLVQSRWLCESVSVLLFILRIAATCRMVVLKLRDSGKRNVARACHRAALVFCASAAVSIVTYHFGMVLLDSYHWAVDDAVWTIGLVFFFAGLSVLAYAAYTGIAVFGMDVAVRAAEAGLPYRQGDEFEAASLAIAWARSLAVVTAVSGVLVCSYGLSILVMIVSSTHEAISNFVYLLAHSSNAIQVLLLSALLGPPDVRQTSEGAFLEMARLGGFARQHARRVSLAARRGEPSCSFAIQSLPSGSMISAGSERGEWRVEEPRRRRPIWITLAALLLAFQLILYFVSDDGCRPWLHEVDSMLKEQFYASSLAGTLGPWVTLGLVGIVLDHRGRFRTESSLHLWTRRIAVCSALEDAIYLLAMTMACSHIDLDELPPKVVLAVELLRDGSSFLRVANLVMSCWMLVLKFYDMGQESMARICYGVLSLFFLSYVVFIAHVRISSFAEIDLGFVDPVKGYLTSISTRTLGLVVWSVYSAFLATALWGLHSAARAAEARLPDRLDEGFDAAQRSVHWAKLIVVVITLSGVFTVMHGVIVFQRYEPGTFDTVRVMVMTNALYVFSHAMNCMQVALLSALLGPESLRQSNEEAFADVGRLGGCSLQDVRRITFQGHVSGLSQVCIVSFPGVYADLWSEVTRLQRRQASVACVFLPSVSSGLGQHAPDPENPENPCYCCTIYPPFQVSSYLRVLPKSEALDDPEEYREKLAFERADAVAQGICLLVEADHHACLWERAKRGGLRKAQGLCVANGSRAPWGCMWFAKWVSNVEMAVRLGQKLIVFYHKNRVGCGKLVWGDLADATKVGMASIGGGLGASQRVEVAYLDRKGYEYTELCVTEFMDQFGIGDGRAMTV